MKKDKDKYDWLPTECAPEFYPVQVLRGRFLREGEGVGSIPRGTSVDFTKWGSPGSTVVGGTNKRSYPDALEIEWFSFAENKFYKGAFDLPYERIKELYDKGIPRSYGPKRPSNYNYIIAGMAPGGVVVVWLCATVGGRTVEVGKYQAKEIPPVDLNKFLPAGHSWHKWPDRKAAQDDFAKVGMKIADGAVENFEKHGLQLGLWDKYRERYNIRVLPIYEDKISIVDEIYTESYNGECVAISEDELAENAFSMKSPIKKISVFFSTGRKMFSARIEMDEQEVFEMYKYIYQDDPTREVDVRVEVNRENDFICVWLSGKAKGERYPREKEFRKAKISIYTIDESGRSQYSVFSDEFEKEYPYARKDGKDL